METKKRKSRQPEIDENLDAFIERYKQGESIADLAEYYGVNWRTIQSRLKRHAPGIIRTKDEGRNLYHSKINERWSIVLSGAIKLYAQGYTLHEIADRYAVIYVDLYLRMVEAGVVFRRRGSRPGNSQLSPEEASEMREIFEKGKLPNGKSPSITLISKIYAVSRQTIYNELKRERDRKREEE